MTDKAGLKVSLHQTVISLYGVVLCVVGVVTLGEDVPVMPCRDGTEETVPCTLVCDTIKDCVNGADEDPAICPDDDYIYPDLVHVPECYVPPAPLPAGVIVAWTLFALILLIVLVNVLAARRVISAFGCLRPTGQKKEIPILRINSVTPTDSSHNRESLTTCGLTMPPQQAESVREETHTEGTADDSTVSLSTDTQDSTVSMSTDTQDSTVSMSTANVETENWSQENHSELTYPPKIVMIKNNYGIVQTGLSNKIQLHDAEQYTEKCETEEEMPGEQEPSVWHCADVLDPDGAEENTS